MTPPAQSATPRARRADDPTLGELGRILTEVRDEQRSFRGEVGERFDKLDTTYVRRDVYDTQLIASAAYLKGLVDRIEELEGTNQWLLRLVVGLVVTALIGGLFAARAGGVG